MKKIPNSVKLILKLVISLLFFKVLLSFVQTRELVSVFQHVNWFYLALSFGVTLIMVAASCAKWKIILDLKGRPQPFWQLFRVYLIGYFFSNILPSTVGGDVVRSYYAGTRIKSQSFAAVSVFVERFSGIFFLFLLAAVAPLFQPHLYNNPYILFPALGGLGFAILTIWVCVASNPFRVPDRIIQFILVALSSIAKRTGWNWLEKSGQFLASISDKLVAKGAKLREELRIASDAIRQDRTFLRRLVWLTILFYGLTWVNVYVSFLAFDVRVNFLAVCAIVPAIMFVAHLPVTLLGNLGYFESVFVFYFLIVGVGGAETLAMGLLLRLKMLSLGGIGFFVYMLYRQNEKLDLTKAVDKSSGTEGV